MRSSKCISHRLKRRKQSWKRLDCSLMLLFELGTTALRSCGAYSATIWMSDNQDEDLIVARAAGRPGP
jgi:hypothetical protein